MEKDNPQKSGFNRKILRRFHSYNSDELDIHIREKSIGESLYKGRKTTYECLIHLLVAVFSRYAAFQACSLLLKSLSLLPIEPSPIPVLKSRAFKSRAVIYTDISSYRDTI